VLPLRTSLTYIGAVFPVTKTGVASEEPFVARQRNSIPLDGVTTTAANAALLALEFRIITPALAPALALVWLKRRQRALRRR